MKREDKTFVVPTSYEKNYNADFLLTKQDIKNNKIDEATLQKIKDDLYVLDNHPDYIKRQGKDIDYKTSNEILKGQFNENYYINKNGELVENGQVLFSKNNSEQKEKRGIYNVQYNERR